MANKSRPETAPSPFRSGQLSNAGHGTPTLVGVGVGVFVGVGVGVLVGVSVGVAVGVLVGVTVGVGIGVLVGVFVGVLVGVAVGVLAAPALVGFGEADIDKAAKLTTTTARMSTSRFTFPTSLRDCDVTTSPSVAGGVKPRREFRSRGCWECLESS